MPVFDINDISFAYPSGETALKNITLAIEQGEKIVLLGPNGCGKSTLQKILSGLLFPARGSIRAFGRELTARHMLDKQFSAIFRCKVGFIFQNSDVQMFCASVLDEIMFGPLAMGLSVAEARERAESLMDYTGITDLAGRLPHHLSGGEKKKVMIAAILATNPDVLLLDEPTNGLDPRMQRWMVETLQELHAQGKTIITATHQLDLVMELAERAIVLGEGHNVVADDAPLAVLGNRQLLLAANLIDEKYHVHVHGKDHHVHLHRGEDGYDEA